MSLNFSNNDIVKNEIKRGNHHALVYLMRTYHHSLCSYCFNLCNDYDKSKDIVQNVFIKLWVSRHNIHSIKSIKDYLYKSVRNAVVDEWRKEQRISSILKRHLEVLAQIDEDEDQELLNEQIKLMEYEIQNLPKKCKKIFLLSKKDGLTNNEIANFLNISTRTVEGHMNKAFRILREKLKDKKIYKTTINMIF